MELWHTKTNQVRIIYRVYLNDLPLLHFKSPLKTKWILGQFLEKGSLIRHKENNKRVREANMWSALAAVSFVADFWHATGFYGRCHRCEVAGSWMIWEIHTHTQTHSVSSHICPPTHSVTPNHLSEIILSLSLFLCNTRFLLPVSWWICHGSIFTEQHGVSHTLCGSALSLSVRGTWG